MNVSDFSFMMLIFVSGRLALKIRTTLHEDKGYLGRHVGPEISFSLLKGI
jgi:hypothetical protein